MMTARCIKHAFPHDQIEISHRIPRMEFTIGIHHLHSLPHTSSSLLLCLSALLSLTGSYSYTLIHTRTHPHYTNTTLTHSLTHTHKCKQGPGEARMFFSESIGHALRSTRASPRVRGAPLAPTIQIAR